MYATQQDLIDRYGTPRLVQLTDIGLPQTGEINATVVAGRLADASAEVDGYFGARVAVPMAAPVAPMVRLVTTRIAYALLLGAAASDTDRADLADARKYLMAIARGEIPLPSAAVDANSATPAGDTVAFEPGRKDWGGGE